MCENSPCLHNLHSVTQTTVTSQSLHQPLNTLEEMLLVDLATS